MRTISCFIIYAMFGVMCGFAQDRDEIFTRPPVRGSFYKLLSKDELEGRGNIVAGKVVSASGILGHVNVGLPYISSATHEPWIEIGTRILSASDVANIPESLNWYTAKLVIGVTQWVMDQDTIANALSPVTIIYATEIVSITSTTNIVNATYIDVDIIDARVFNIDIVNATYIDVDVSNVDIQNVTNIYAAALVTEKYEQLYPGDGGTSDITLDHIAHTEGFVLEAVTDPHISHVNEWVLDSAYSQTLDGDGYVVSISITSGYRWYEGITFRIRYVRADL